MQNQFLIGMGAALWLAAALVAQTPPVTPTPAVPPFEVASIKPSPPLDPMKIMAGQMHIGMSVDAARVDIGSASLTELIRLAYRVKPYQVSGPDWMASQRFDVLAKMPAGVSKEQVPEMMQALLAERFKLTVHRDSKEHPIYALVVAKSGTKLKEAEPDSLAPPAVADSGPSKPGTIVVGSGENQVRVDRSADGRGGTVAGGPFGKMKFSVGEGGMVRMEYPSLNMQGLVDMLTRFTDRPVIDMTGLKGNYQVALDLSMEEMRNVAKAMAMQAGIAIPPGPMGRGDAPKSPADAASTPSGNSLFAAVQQLGLKLEPRKAPLETVVVDHLEKTPTEN